MKWKDPEDKFGEGRWLKGEKKEEDSEKARNRIQCPV
jgi:hypothetical protein